MNLAMIVALDTCGKPLQVRRVDREFALKEVAVFDVERFVTDCRGAFAADSSHKAIHEIVARAMSEPSAVLKGPANRSVPKAARCSIPTS